MDLSQIPTEDLEHISRGDMSKVSTATLEKLAGSDQASTAGYKVVEAPLPGQKEAEQPSIAEEMDKSSTPWTADQLKGALELRQAGDGVPEWARRSPNAYAAAETALDFAPMLANFAKGTGVGIPLAGAINVGAKAVQRGIAGKGTTGGDVLGDFAKGATVEGFGRGLNAFIKGAANVPAIQEAKNAAARKLYQSAMKFSTSPNVLAPAERAAVTETGLKGQFLPNDASYLRLKDTVDGNTKAVDEIIDQATAAGDTVPAATIMQHTGFPELQARGEAVRGVSPGYTGAVNDIERNLLAGEGKVHPHEVPFGNSDYTARLEPGGTTKPYTPNDINISKRQMYKELEDAYGQSTLGQPSVQAKKQLAAGLKSTLEALYPEVKNLNANSAELLALSDHLARSMGRIGNRDVIGLGDKIVMDMVTGKAANPAALAGGFLSLIDRPQIKARLALALYKANTGKSLPLTQWQKGLQYLGQISGPAARTALEGTAYKSDPLGIRGGAE